MKRTELFEIISEKTGVTPKEVESVINAFTEFVASELKSQGKFTLRNFGTLTTHIRYKYVIPKTDIIIDKPVRYVSFSQSEYMRRQLNGCKK
jgi:bacterial DNA-binding protein